MWTDTMYRAVTRQIEVIVEPSFLPERSSAEDGRFFWAYTIAIVNSGNETVQLKRRHWIITDGAAAVRKLTVKAWSGSSRCSSQVNGSSTPAAYRFRHPPGS